MLLDMESLYNSDQFSDITIKLTDREIKAHTVVLCSKSEYFNDLCGPDSTFKENKAATIGFLDEDPNAMDIILRSMYIGEEDSYDDYDERVCTPFSPNWHLHLLVLVAAEKYGLPDVKEYAIASMDYEIWETSDPEIIFEMIQALQCYSDEYPEGERTIDRLIDENLGALWKIKEFRALSEEDDDIHQKVLDRLDSTQCVYYTCKEDRTERTVLKYDADRGEIICFACGRVLDKTEARVCWIKNT